MVLKSVLKLVKINRIFEEWVSQHIYTSWLNHQIFLFQNGQFFFLFVMFCIKTYQIGSTIETNIIGCKNKNVFEWEHKWSFLAQLNFN